jgi:hypothetical protein
MIYCKDCEFDYDGYWCSRKLQKNKYTGLNKDHTLLERRCNDDGKCPDYEKKRGFFAKLIDLAR